MSGIGLIIFTALDYGLGEDQERALSDDLECLLDLLASEGKSIKIRFVLKKVIQKLAKIGIYLNPYVFNVLMVNGLQLTISKNR